MQILWLCDVWREMDVLEVHRLKNPKPEEMKLDTGQKLNNLDTFYLVR